MRLFTQIGLSVAVTFVFGITPVLAATSTPINISTSTPATASSTDLNATNTAIQTDSGGTDAPGSDSIQVSHEGIYEQAQVLDIASRAQEINGIGQQVEVYRLKFTSGQLKGQERDIVNEVGSNPYGLKLHKGDRVVVLMQNNPDGSLSIYIEGFDRRMAIWGLIALFVFVMILLSGWQGFKVSLSILLSIFLIGWILIPAFLRGVNPVPIAILLMGALTFISTGMSTGWNRKSVITAIGTIGGSLMAFLIAWVFADWANLNGLASEDDRLFFDKNPLLNPRGLLFAGIIIASAGVVEDVAVSIASGVSEVKKAKPDASFRELFRSGMVIGNDHMAALANTLVFAYVGSSLSTLLLYQQFGSSWLKFINFDSVVDEIIRSLAGTIGLVFTVPITALLAAWVTKNEEQNDVPNKVHTHRH